MKTIVRILVVFVALNLFFAAFPKQASAQEVRVSFRVFYDQLSPYGRWIAYPYYGYVWVPNVGPDFMPYATDGYWEYTDYGWTWVSDYSWGWAPFHYGRWDYDNNYGWFWVPDNEWGPAWVVWRKAEGYYGWAPMKPGITINVVYGKGYHIPHNHWIFVKDGDFDRHDISHYYINREQNKTIIGNSRIMNNAYEEKGKRANYFAGPDRNEVQRFTGKPVRRLSVHIADKPERRNISKDRIDIYKPQVVKESDNHKYSPKPVEKWNKHNNTTKNINNQHSNNAPVINNNTKSVQQDNRNTEIKQNTNNRQNNSHKEKSAQQTNRTNGNRR